MRALAVTLASGALLLWPATARAWERSQGFGLDAGLAMLNISDGPTELGVTFGIHYSLRLTDQLDLVGELGGAVTDLDPVVTPTTPADRPSNLWNLDAGVIYKLDIVRFVPYFGALAGGYVLRGGSMPKALILPGAELAVGGDYLLSRSWAVGLAIREHFLFTDMGTYPSYLTVTARVEFTWGSF